MNNNQKPDTKNALSSGAGIAFGISVDFLFGLAMNNIPLGLPLGVALGVGLGYKTKKD